MNKNQLNTELGKVTQAQADMINSANPGFVMYIISPGTGSSYTPSELIDEANGLSDADFFWLEENSTNFYIAAKRSGRPC